MQSCYHFILNFSYTSNFTFTLNRNLYAFSSSECRRLLCLHFVCDDKYFRKNTQMIRKAEIKKFQHWLLKLYLEYIKLRPMIVTLLGSGSFGMHIFTFAFGKKLKIDFINIWKLSWSQFLTLVYIYIFFYVT